MAFLRVLDRTGDTLQLILMDRTNMPRAFLAMTQGLRLSTRLVKRLPQKPQEPPGTPDFVNSQAVKACAERLFGITQAGLITSPETAG